MDFTDWFIDCNGCGMTYTNAYFGEEQDELPTEYLLGEDRHNKIVDDIEKLNNRIDLLFSHLHKLEREKDSQKEGL